MVCAVAFRLGLGQVPDDVDADDLAVAGTPQSW